MHAGQRQPVADQDSPHQRRLRNHIVLRHVASPRAINASSGVYRRRRRINYPEIVARQVGTRDHLLRGIIFCGDEAGLRSDDLRGRSYALRDQTPLVRVCRRWAGLSHRQ
jgi:hypothetical protein